MKLDGGAGVAELGAHEHVVDSFGDERDRRVIDHGPDLEIAAGEPHVHRLLVRAGMAVRIDPRGATDHVAVGPRPRAAPRAERVAIELVPCAGQRERRSIGDLAVLRVAIEMRARVAHARIAEARTSAIAAVRRRGRVKHDVGVVLVESPITDRVQREDGLRVRVERRRGGVLGCGRAAEQTRCHAHAHQISDSSACRV
jgi:hypothetical protein